MKKWNVCDASWILLGVTIILVSLVPAFHQTPWQVVLSLGEGWAMMLTASVTLLPMLFLYQMQRTTGTIDILRFLFHQISRLVMSVLTQERFDLFAFRQIGRSGKHLYQIPPLESLGACI